MATGLATKTDRDSIILNYLLCWRLPLRGCLHGMEHVRETGQWIEEEGKTCSTGQKQTEVPVRHIAAMRYIASMVSALSQ